MRRVRVPAWLRASPKISVNGKLYEGPARPGTFAGLRRRWKNNDTVDVSFPLEIRTQPIDDRNPQIVALMKGPLMLVRINPTSDAIEPLAIPTTLDRSSADPTLLQTPGHDVKVSFRPFYAVNEESYSTYFHRA